MTKQPSNSASSAPDPESQVVLDVDVIVDASPQDGSFNMSMDEALLQLGAERRNCIVRIYSWKQPTVTLGYFQARQPEQQSPFPDLPVVRRLSGGGAILHDQELTYSCVVPATHPVRHDPSKLYEIVHHSLIQLLGRCGVQSCLRSEYERRLSSSIPKPSQLAAEATGPEAFLCFLRQNANDIVEAASGTKIVGSAQRRRKGVILQHGSILLGASSMTPELPGIAELVPGFDLLQFRQRLPEAIAGPIGRDVRFRGYTDEEQAVSAEIVRQWSE